MAYLTEVFADLPSGTVSSGGTTAPSAGTSESWTVSVSAAFAALHSGSQHFYAADKNLPGEVFEVTACPGGTGSQSWTVTRGADGTATVAHASGFTVVQVASAATLGALKHRPWQFLAEDYGAAGDAKIGTGGTGTSGTATFTDSGASFVNATVANGGDIGKYIIINAGTSGSGTANGTSQNPFCGTIIAVGSATSVTLSGNLPATCTAAPYVYGRDNSAAIQSCISAAATWASSNGSYAEIILTGQYMLGTLTQQTTPDKRNTHLSVPYGTQTGQRLALKFRGLGSPQIEYWQSTQPSITGPALISGIFPPNQPDATFGNMSILGGPSGQIGSGQFANLRLEIDGISFVAPWNSQIYGVDGRWIAQMIVPRAHFTAFVPVNTTSATIGGPYAQNVPSNTIAIGFAYPWAANNAANYGGVVTGETVTYPVACSEHSTFTRLTGLYCTSACYVHSAPSLPHALTITHLLSEGSANALDASALSGVTLPVHIGMIETEFMTNSIINDPNNALTGTIRTGAGGASFPTVLGGQRLIVLDDQLHNPGPWSGAPAVPASGTATTNLQQNLSYRYANIYASATTITAVFTGPPGATTLTQLTGVTQASGGPGVRFRVAPGHQWSATYTGTLTASWVLD